MSGQALSQDQLEKLVKIVEAYKQTGDSDDVTLDEDRNAKIPEIQKIVREYIEMTIEAGAFKSAIDTFNKNQENNKLWGFKGAGLPGFNGIYKNSPNEEKLNEVMRDVIKLPGDIVDAENKINKLATFCAEVKEETGTRAINGAIPFILSWFWGIQEPEKWPIIYTSMKKTLLEQVEYNLDAETSISERYVKFYKINMEIKEHFQNAQNITLWDIEHALYKIPIIPIADTQGNLDSGYPQNTNTATIPGYITLFSAKTWPYIPPIIADLPLLAEGVENPGEQKKASRRFEEQVAKLFTMLGLETELLGQGSGSEPDGISLCKKHHYAIIWDAKSYKDGYSIGINDTRAVKDYIKTHAEGLEREEMDNTYFLFISSKFKNKGEKQAKEIRIEQKVTEVVFMEIEALLELLTRKLKEGYLSLGLNNGNGLQSYFSMGGVVTINDI
jgi:hypothetical protein